MATSSVVRGVAALLVDVMLIDPSGFFTNQVHPEPKVPRAILLNSAMNASSDPQVFTIADLRSPSSFAEPVGAKLSK